VSYGTRSTGAEDGEPGCPQIAPINADSRTSLSICAHLRNLWTSRRVGIAHRMPTPGVFFLQSPPASAARQQSRPLRPRPLEPVLFLTVGTQARRHLGTEVRMQPPIRRGGQRGFPWARPLPDGRGSDPAPPPRGVNAAARRTNGPDNEDRQRGGYKEMTVLAALGWRPQKRGPDGREDGRLGGRPLPCRPARRPAATPAGPRSSADHLVGR